VVGDAGWELQLRDDGGGPRLHLVVEENARRSPWLHLLVRDDAGEDLRLVIGEDTGGDLRVNLFV
jgi:hypothetical protein